MSRFMMIALSILAIYVSVLGMRLPNTELSSFLLVSREAFWLRIVGSFIVVNYALFSPLRFGITKKLMLLLGISLTFLSIVGVMRLHLLVLDEFMSLSGGIFAILGAIELPTTKRTPNFSIRLPRLKTDMLQTSAQDSVR